MTWLGLRVEAALDGSGGFEQFVADRSRVLLRTAWVLTGDWARAEDLVQSALVTAWQHWESIERKDAPEVYVHTVLVNTSRRWRRRHWVGEVPTADLPERPIADHVGELVQRDVLAGALRALPARQRAVLGLRYISDLTEQQTAAVLGCTVGTVKSQASKGLQRLRRTPGLAEAFERGQSDV